MERRIGVAAVLATIAIPTVFVIFQVQEWKMPDLVAGILIAIASTVGIICIVVVGHGIWVISAPHRRGWSLRSPLYDQNVANRPVDDEAVNIHNAEHARLAGVLNTMILDDRDNSHRTYHIIQGDIDWTHVTQRVGAYMVFSWTVYSSSVYTMQFGEQPTGKIKYLSPIVKNLADISRDPELGEVDDILGPLKRTFNGIFRLKQFLPDDVRADIGLNQGQPVRFDFSEVHFPVAQRTPDGQPGPPLQVRVPSTWNHTVPMFETWEAHF